MCRGLYDRWFLDRIATHILAWEGDDEDQAKWFWYEGTSPSTRPTRSPGSAWRRLVRTGDPPPPHPLKADLSASVVAIATIDADKSVVSEELGE